MSIGIVHGVLTAIVLALFIGLWAWSWSRKRSADFEAASRLPLGDDTRPAGAESDSEREQAL